MIVVKSWVDVFTISQPYAHPYGCNLYWHQICGGLHGIIALLARKYAEIEEL